MKDYCPNDCGICRENKEICYYSSNNLSFKCPICKEDKSPHDIYEYKNKRSCADCFVFVEKTKVDKVNNRFEILDIRDE